MLVDESESLSNADVAREIQAAGTIAQAPLNPRSRITIIGFGGVNGVAPDQDPTDVACAPTITSGKVSLNYLAKCVHRLHRRTEKEGDDTDYAAALAQAMFYLGPNTTEGQKSPAGATKAIFLMTDGALDVSRDPQYVKTGNWQNAAQHAVNLQLAAARAAHVEVWTLGFGSISPSAATYLKYLAASGGQKACDTRGASRPRSTVVGNSTTALDALNSLYAAASCSGVVKSPKTVVSGGNPRTLSVSIPVIASAVAITVDKVNPNIRVTYQTPSGTEVSGAAIGSMTFERSGQDTAVDVLHVTDPEPGQWKILLTAPNGLKGQLVSATAFWQGAVRALVFASPSSARTSQAISVTLSVLGPDGSITELSALKGVQATVSVTGDGITTPVNVPVTNSGENAATPTGVADYKGTFTAPASAGTLVFTGTVVGYGLHATQAPQEVQVGAPSAMLQCTITYSAPAMITAGQSVSGQALCRNQTGRSQRVLLALATSHALASVTAPSGAVTVASGNSQISFTIAFDSGSPAGNASVVVKVANAANSSTIYGAGPLTITVEPAPGPFKKYKWEILGGLILLLLLGAFLILRRRARRAAMDVRGLSAVLKTEDDSSEINAIKAPNRRSDTFKFTIKESDGRTRLAAPQSQDEVYTARRDVTRNRRTGTVMVITPERNEMRLRIGGASDELPTGGRLAFRDAPTAKPARPRDNGTRSAANDSGGDRPPPQGPSSEMASKDIWR